MNSNRISGCLILLATSLFVLNNIHAGSKKSLVQDDPVLAPDVATVPIVDGIGDDPCWQNVPWQSIDEVWVNYVNPVSADDYTGRYKVVWSSATNLLYFLMEVTDDEFVDGYAPNSSGGAIYDFDISEVFIDEDTSGGEHIYDSGSTNAENAFAYHMYADIPAEGEATTAWLVDDMAGIQGRRVDYTSHFPELALRVNGQTAVREFSLIVYNDTYTDSNKDAARARLEAGKVMGLSVAYCDNDDPYEYPKVRDNMFGSVWEPNPRNLHWMNADYFGRVKLVSDIPSGVMREQAASVNTIKLFPNPASSSLKLQLHNSYRGEVSIRLFNILGQEVFRTSASKTEHLLTQPLVLSHLPPGSYFIQTQMGQSVFRGKLIRVDKK